MRHPLPLPLHSAGFPLSSYPSPLTPLLLPLSAPSPLCFLSRLVSLSLPLFPCGSAPVSLFFLNLQGSLVSMATPGDLSLVTKEQMTRPLS